MKRTVFLLIFTFLYPVFVHGQPPTAPYLPAQRTEEAQNAPITVQFPYEKMKTSRRAKNIFLFGKLNVKSATLDINGQAVPVTKSGAFIAYVPVEQGDFEFLLTAKNKTGIYQAVRRIVVPGTPVSKFTQTATLDPEEAAPQSLVELLPGEVLDLSVRGTPGTRVFYTAEGLNEANKVEMTESSIVPGTYRAKYIIDPDQKPRTAKVTYEMENGPNNSKAEITAPAKVRVLDMDNPFTVARIKTPGVKLRKIPTATENLFPFYRAYGEVLLAGQSNKQYRLMLNDKESAWLEGNHLEILPTRSYKAGQVNGLRTHSTAEKTELTFNISKEVPLEVREFNDRLEITFYYTESFEENFSLDSTTPLVEHITWSQPTAHTLKFKIFFKPGQMPWGHAYDYKEGKLMLELIHPPALAATAKEPLKGARILLDAGHSPNRTLPYDGTIGPSGYLEYEANMALVEELKPLLEKAGATVLLTRQGNNRMGLPERHRFAVEQNAHVFISLHYNALPETINPLAQPRGFSVYYNYPHSFKLAQAVYEAFTRHVPIADNGLIANDVLFIPRIPHIPSILVENAFLILPEQEELAKTKEGRAAFIKALYEGILDFYGVKPAVKKAPAPRKRPRI